MLQRDIHDPELATVTLPAAHQGRDITLAYSRFRPAGDHRGTVVYVHGLTRQKRDADYIGAFLSAQGYDFYSVDAPGRGDSGWLDNADDYSVLVYADIFKSFLVQMNFSRVHWIGTSMGGLIAMVMALKGDAGFFQSLTLNDITHKPNGAALKRITNYLSETLPVFANRAQYEDVLRQNLPLGPVPQEVWSHYAQHQLRETPDGFIYHYDPKLVRRALVDLKADIDLGAALPLIPCPVALIAGGVSDLCTAQEIDDFKTLRPDAKIHIVPGAGHVPALADDATQQFILAHLRNTAA
ncbi:MAG: putative esterase/lipase/thioesterase family protein [Alphaproteobacteria bacterium]|nr:putative esterase/lipase/thioesterase family protein [Alphaproteobacteria bacterium]